ncbi:hypothetical protein DIPPA_11517 [Diplonema papillatum]|nr:hypothetical protein DIPPA_11517 [Diplonema papillatum]
MARIPNGVVSVSAELRELFDLHNVGALTDAEFAAAKSIVLRGSRFAGTCSEGGVLEEPRLDRGEHGGRAPGAGGKSSADLVASPPPSRSLTDELADFRLLDLNPDVDGCIAMAQEAVCRLALALDSGAASESAAFSPCNVDFAAPMFTPQKMASPRYAYHRATDEKLAAARGGRVPLAPIPELLSPVHLNGTFGTSARKPDRAERPAASPLAPYPAASPLPPDSGRSGLCGDEFAFGEPELLHWDGALSRGVHISSDGREATCTRSNGGHVVVGTAPFDPAVRGGFLWNTVLMLRTIASKDVLVGMTGRGARGSAAFVLRGDGCIVSEVYDGTHVGQFYSKPLGTSHSIVTTVSITCKIDGRTMRFCVDGCQLDKAFELPPDMQFYPMVVLAEEGEAAILPRGKPR